MDQARHSRLLAASVRVRAGAQPPQAHAHGPEQQCQQSVRAGLYPVEHTLPRLQLQDETAATGRATPGGQEADRGAQTNACDGQVGAAFLRTQAVRL